MNKKQEKKILRKLIAITGIGCWNCNASQLVEYYDVKVGKALHHYCKNCIIPKKARMLN